MNSVFLPPVTYRYLAAIAAAIVVLSLSTGSAAAQELKFQTSQETGGAPGRYRVQIDLRPGDDLIAISNQLAATYGARIEPYAEEGFVGFAIMATPARARLMSKDPRVIAIQDLAAGIVHETPVAPAAQTAPPTISSQHTQRRVATESTVPGFGVYTYDGSGNITSIDDHVFRYDAYARLQKAVLGTLITQTFKYDRYGNILEILTNGNSVARMSVDPNTNQIDLPFDPATNANMIAQYDASGNLVSHQQNQFVYDALNLVKETTDTARRIHLYTASDERVAVITVQNNVETSSEWTLRDAGNRVLRRLTKDTAGAWHWKEDYIYAGSRLLAAEVTGPERVRHFHLDHLGTPRLITGNGGVQIATKTYQPFGLKASTTTPDFEQLEFTGHERDVPTLDYMHARYYKPDLGRFLSVDPVPNDRLAIPQAWNRYSYVLNNPMLRVDPSGRKDKLYWLQSFNWRETSSVNGVVQTAVRGHNYNVEVNYFASKADILSTLSKAEATDIVVVQSHAARPGMRESGFFGPKEAILSKEIANAVGSDTSRPDAVILAGCGTDRSAATVAAQTGVPAFGTNSGVGIGVGTNAVGRIVESLLSGSTPQEAAAAGNQYLDSHPVACSPYPCDGNFIAFELTTVESPHP